MKKISFILAILCITFSLSAEIIYVSPSGNDSNSGSGTENNPFGSLQRAIDYARTIRSSKQLTSPIEIKVASGMYPISAPITLTGADSGTEQSPLIITGSGVSMPIISGGVKLEGKLEKVTDHMWKMSVPNIPMFQQLFVNGKRAIRARTPNLGWRLYITPKVDEVLLNGGGTKDLKLEDQKAAVDNSFAMQTIKLTESQYESLRKSTNVLNSVVCFNHAWDQTRRYVENFSKKDSTITIIGKQAPIWNRLDRASQFYFENSMSYLDAPGEWYLETDGTLYYVPQFEESIENTEMIVPVLEEILFIQGTENQKVENVYFNNISFQHSRYILPRVGDEPDQASSSTKAAVSVNYANNINFDKCEIAKTANSAIWFKKACTNSKVTRSYLHDLGISGVKIGDKEIPENEDELLTRNITIDNNIIRSGSHEIPTGVGVILFRTSDNMISHNDISDFKYSGVSVGWVWGYNYSPTKRNKIIYNHIHHLGWGELSDMGGVYTLASSEGSEVSNNVIHDIYSYAYGGWGLYTDEGSTGIKMENNIVYNCKSSGFHQHYGKDNIIRNNIFVNQIRAQLETTKIEKHNSFSFTNNIIYFTQGKLYARTWDKVNAIVDQNCYWHAGGDTTFDGKALKEWQKSTGKDKRSIIANPLFSNIAQGDFTLNNKSVLSKIGFKPFDYNKAGVYGDTSWTELAKFDYEQDIIFQNVVKRMEADKIEDGE